MSCLEERRILSRVPIAEATIGSCTPHKITTIAQVVEPDILCTGSRWPEVPGAAEEEVHYLADSPYTQPLIAMVKANVIPDTTHHKVSCDVAIYLMEKNAPRSLHQPGTEHALFHQAEQNFTQATIPEGKTFHGPLIAMYCQIALAMLSEPHGDVFIQHMWFFLRPFTLQELRAYIEENPKAKNSNGGFLIQAKAMRDRIVAISNKQGTKMCQATEERLADLKSLLLGSPSSLEIREKMMKRIRGNLLNQGCEKPLVHIDTIMQKLKKFHLHKPVQWSSHRISS